MLASHSCDFASAILSIEAESVLVCGEDDEVYEQGIAESRSTLLVTCRATCSFGGVDSGCGGYFGART
jgi:hypothetical protein